MQKLEGHIDLVRTATFSLDGSLRLATASVSVDKTVRLWDAGTRKEVYKCEDVLSITTIKFTIGNDTLFTSRGALPSYPIEVRNSTNVQCKGFGLSHSFLFEDVLTFNYNYK
jgi:WD40 repeat protein